jgi:hypothetical protein
MASSSVSPIIINKECNLLLIDFPFSAQVAFLFPILASESAEEGKVKYPAKIRWQD